jgi:hypothetical protein
MCKVVCKKSRLSGESLVAKLATIRTLTAMKVFVAYNVSFATELLITHLTGIRALTSVSGYVPFYMVFLWSNLFCTHHTGTEASPGIKNKC